MSFQWFKKSSWSCLKSNRPDTPDTPQPETSTGASASTILDVMITDCWRIILDQLDIYDVIRSERVSRGWQCVVLEHLRGYHNYGIRNAAARTPTSNRFWQSKHNNTRVIHINFDKKDNYDQMIKKIGPFVVKLYTDCICIRSLLSIAESCPFIKYIEFFDINFENLNLTLPTTAVEYPLDCLRSLKRMSFHTCRQLFKLEVFLYVSFNLQMQTYAYWKGVFSSRVQHFCSCMFSKNKTFEGLGFINSSSNYIIEQALNFWLDYKWTALESVTLSRLDESESSLIEWSGIEIASSTWTRMTKLRLDDNSIKIFNCLNAMLEYILNLELFSLCGYAKYDPCYYRKDITRMDVGCSPRREWSYKLVESIGRHSGLKHLYLARNDNVDDEWLEIIARRCTELRTLDIGSCKDVSSLGALQLLAPTLEKLSLPDNILVTDTDLIECIRVCQRLRFLDVSRCSGATPRLVHGAERGTQHRAPPLQLRLDETDMSTVQILRAAGFEVEMQKRRESYPWYLPQEIQVRHKGLTLHWSNKAPEAHLPLRGPLAAEYRYDSVLRL